MEVCIRVIIRILHLTTTGTEYEAYIYRTIRISCLLKVSTRILHTTVCQCSLNRAYLTTANYNSTFTCVSCPCLGFSTYTTSMSWVSTGKVSSFECSYRTHQTSAIHTVEDVAATHVDIGVTLDIRTSTAAIDRACIDIDTFKACNARIIHSSICIFSCRLVISIKYRFLLCIDVHVGVTRHISQIATTKDITCNVSAKNIRIDISHSTGHVTILDDLAFAIIYRISSLIYKRATGNTTISLQNLNR